MLASRALFVDTSGWAEQIVQNQPTHLAIVREYRNALVQQRPLVTTNYILMELVPLLASRARIAREDLFKFIDALQAIPHLEIVHIDSATHQEAWQLLKARPDKAWSLVDASSFVVMTHHHINEALTTDFHFSQAGFMWLVTT